jgi:hypothetical protein
VLLGGDGCAAEGGEFAEDLDWEAEGYADLYGVAVEVEM